jgi:hypothetical protein
VDFEETVGEVEGEGGSEFEEEGLEDGGVG